MASRPVNDYFDADDDGDDRTGRNSAPAPTAEEEEIDPLDAFMLVICTPLVLFSG